MSVLIITAALILVGCNENEDAKETTQASKKESITVTHRLGETTVNLSPKNVVVFDYGVLDTLRALNVNVKALPKEPLPKYLSQFSDAKYINVGSLKEPNLEEISRLEPDLIIISGRQADIYPELVKLGPTLLMGVDNKAYVSSMKENMKILGKIFQKEDEVTQLIDKLDKRIADFKTITEENKQSGSSPKALAMIVTEGNLNAFGPGSRFGLLYDELGFTPVDNELEITNHGQKVTYEYLIEKNPDLVFVLDRGEAMGQSKTAEEIMSNQLLSNVNAVKNKQVIYLTGEAWYLSAGGYEGFQIILDDASKALTYSEK